MNLKDKLQSLRDNAAMYDVKVSFRNRAGKQYVILQHAGSRREREMRYDHNSHELFCKLALHVFPTAKCTSFCIYDGTTFRINPEFKKVKPYVPDYQI